MSRLLIPILTAVAGALLPGLFSWSLEARKSRRRLFERAQRTYERALDALQYHRLVSSFFRHPTPGPLPSYLGGNPVAGQERSGERLRHALADTLSVSESIVASFGEETQHRWAGLLERLNSAKDAPGDEDFQRAVEAAQEWWDSFAEKAREECDLTPWKRWWRWVREVLRAGADD